MFFFSSKYIGNLCDFYSNPTCRDVGRFYNFFILYLSRLFKVSLGTEWENLTVDFGVKGDTVYCRFQCFKNSRGPKIKNVIFCF